MTLKLLLVMPPFAGHLYPVVSVATELERRGHQVAWVSHELVSNLLPGDARLYSFASPRLEDQGTHLLQRSAMRWLAGLKSMWEDVIVPMSEDMMPVVEAAAREFQPDAIIADEICPAGAIVAEKMGIPWATSASTGQLHSRELDRLPRVKAWIDARLRQLCAAAGSPNSTMTGTSEDLVLLYTSRALAGESHPYPSHYRFVGPVHSKRKSLGEFPWHKLTGEKIVFASVGTLYRSQGVNLLQAVADGLKGEPLQVVMAGDRDALQDVPENLLLVDWVPQMELLPEVDAVITQGGITVEESLSFGLPLVVAPIAQDQFILADQVVRAGAGLRVRADRVTGNDIRRAITSVLYEPAYREAAKRIQRSFEETGGVEEAADALEALACKRPEGTARNG